MKKKNIQTIAIIILSISLISMTVFAVSKERDTIREMEPEKVFVDKESGETLDNFSREAAVAKLTEIIQAVGDDERSIEDRLIEIEDEETDIDDVLSKEVVESLYLEKKFSENEFNRRFTASSLLVFNNILTDESNQEVEPVMVNVDEIVYFDEELLVAHIPLDIYTGTGTGIAFEMQYIDGEWKLNPYTAAMSLNLMTILTPEESNLEE